ncbi:MAG: hypothetical protein NTV31_15175 [Bacteroidia bacterium]|nr:hypothetical protein [Bacteroidia bacterium]
MREKSVNENVNSIFMFLCLFITEDNNEMPQYEEIRYIGDQEGDFIFPPE